MIKSEIPFPLEPPYSDEEKIYSYKTFYRRYLLDEYISKKNIQRLGKFIEEANTYLFRNLNRNFVSEEVYFWQIVDKFIKDEFSKKLISEVYSNYLPNKNEGFAIEIIKACIDVNEYINKKRRDDLLLLGLAEKKIQFLSSLYDCLKEHGLPNIYKYRDPFYFKKYNVRIKPMGILEEYTFLLDHRSVKNIKNAFRFRQDISFNGKYIPFHRNREIHITSTLLKDDEVELFLKKIGVKTVMKKWKIHHEKKFFESCDPEPNILYNREFHPKEPILQIETSKTNIFDRAVEKRNKKAPTINIGKYRALIIGINKYKQLNDLSFAVEDAKKLKVLLESKYNFVDTIFLQNPNRGEILDSLDILDEQLEERDNLLIFYAGHSEREDKIGYWMPSDAHPKRRRNWINNLVLVSYLEKFSKCQHILLLDDSCYSGHWLETRNKTNDSIISNQIRYISKSRTVFTSGTKYEQVSDNSEFFNQIYNALLNNTDTYFKIPYENIQNKVIMSNTTFLNKTQKPQYGKLPLADDAGGDFIWNYIGSA